MRFGPRAFSRFLRTPADVFQVPPVHTISGREITVITPKLLESAHRSGKHVHAWTIDDPDEMNRLLDLGVDGIVSDRIDVLKDVLTQRDVWTGDS
jgi:glycerophosphoryl diester phosphodiesterase